MKIFQEDTLEDPIFFRYLHTAIYKNKPRVSRWGKLKLKVAHKTGPTSYFLGSKGKTDKRRGESGSWPVTSVDNYNCL